MKNNINGMKKLMFFNIMLITFSWLSLGLSFESWEGETINHVSLRESPGLDQKIVIDLQPGVAITILDKNGDWCQVIAKGTQTQPRSLILRKLGIQELFNHSSAKQSELKGWILEKDIKRVEQKTETQVAAQVKEEKITPEVPGEEKANINQGAQEIKAIPSGDHEATITKPLTSAEQEKAQALVTGKEEKETEKIAEIEKSPKAEPGLETREETKIEALAVTPEKKLTAVSPQTSEVSAGTEKSLFLPKKAGSTQGQMVSKKEELISKPPLGVKANVTPEPQAIKAPPSVSHKAEVTESTLNEKQEKAQALLTPKEEKKVEEASGIEGPPKAEPGLGTREETKIEALAVTPEKTVTTVFPQSPEVVSGTEKSVFSEIPEEPSGLKHQGTPGAQDKEAGNTKTVLLFRDLLRGLALLATGILSCLAFIFSFRAYRIAQKCYQTMIRFQADRKNLLDKEREGN